MNKKQVRIIVVCLQAFLVAAMFLPAGRIIESADKKDSSLSVFGMIQRYAGMGFSDDARLYMIFACIVPVVIVLCVLFLKDRVNFGSATLLSAFYAGASSCFFSASKTKLVDYATMTVLPYIIVLVSLVSMIFQILGFFYATPTGTKKGGNEKN